MHKKVIKRRARKRGQKRTRLLFVLMMKNTTTFIQREIGETERDIEQTVEIGWPREDERRMDKRDERKPNSNITTHL